MNDYEKTILANIEAFGCSVTSVSDPEGEQPPFSYSIGIARSAGAPEVIVVGLAPKLGHWMVNEYNRRVGSGERFERGTLYEGFLDGFAVQFGPVGRTHREHYMRSATWLHDGPDFEAVQLIWPSTSGAWPWDAEASDWFRANRPVLAGSATEEH